MKFQVSPAPGCRPPDRTGKKLGVRCSGGLQAAVRAKGAGKKDFGLEAKATFAKEVSGQSHQNLWTRPPTRAVSMHPRHLVSV